MPFVERIEADDRLAHLVDQAEHGQEVIITKNGRDVARVVSIRQIDWPRRKAAIAALHEFRKEHSLGGISIRQLREEGRRF